jgi:hypothetical protein
MEKGEREVRLLISAIRATDIVSCLFDFPRLGVSKMSIPVRVLSIVA